MCIEQEVHYLFIMLFDKFADIAKIKNELSDCFGWGNTKEIKFLDQRIGFMEIKE